MTEDTGTFHMNLQAERIARLKLKIIRAEKPSWFSHDRVEWQEGGERESLEIPNGLDEAGALRCIEIFNLGHERGLEVGRDDLRERIRSLLGVAKDE